MNETEVGQMVYELIAALNNQTKAINGLIEQNAILIESLADMDEGEEPTGYLDGGSLNG